MLICAPHTNQAQVEVDVSTKAKARLERDLAEDEKLTQVTHVFALLYLSSLLYSSPHPLLCWVFHCARSLCVFGGTRVHAG